MRGPPPDMIEAPGGVAFKVDFATVKPEFAPYLGGINSYHTRVDPGVVHHEIFLPAWSSIRFQPYGGDWSLRYGEHDSNPVPRAAIFGPTSLTGTANVGTGQLLQIDLLPRGWARLIPVSAYSLANRGVPLDTVLPRAGSDVLSALSRAEGFDHEALILETWLAEAVLGGAPEPGAVAEIQELLLDPAIWRVEDAVRALGIEQWTFARLSKLYFGFTPKLLMRRARFMRTILQIREHTTPDFSAIVDEAYTDQSHFIRDCHDFLGMTPGQFAAKFQPIAHASFNAREEVAGNRHHLLPPEPA